MNEIIGINRVTTFVGKRKVGLDANVLIKLYDNPHLLRYEEARIFNFQDTIFIHPICIYELRKYIKKKGLSEEEAIIESDKFLSTHNIVKVKCFIPEHERIDFERKANDDFKAKDRHDLEAHKPDSIILLAYKRCNVNKVISTDRSFRECAKLLGIDGSGLPSLDYTIAREFRRIFNRKNNYKRRRRSR